MGTQSSSSNQSFRSAYLPVHPVDDPYFGKIMLYSRIKEPHDYAFSRLIVEPVSKGIFLRRAKIIHPNLVKLIYIDYRDAEFDLCSGGSPPNSMIGFWEHPGFNTLEIISSQHEFTELQLWSITVQVIQACQYLQHMGTYHGDINPTTIFVTQEQIIKLAEISLVPGIKSAYQKYLTFNEHVCLSPEQLKAFKQGTNKFDPFKADTFAFGMTLLQICTRKARPCYNHKTFSIDQERVKELTDGLQYSDCMKSLISNLLLEDPASRPSFNQIYMNNLADYLREGSLFFQTSTFELRGNTLQFINLASPTVRSPTSQSELRIPMIESIIQLHPISPTVHRPASLRLGGIQTPINQLSNLNSPQNLQSFCLHLEGLEQNR